MDDFNLGNLNEARNEWSARLMNIVTPHIIDGFNTIFKEAYELCLENEEDEKYLMTFQNFLTRIPKWNEDLIKKEVERLIETSGCNYLTELITCVHIIQLKALTSVRVGQKQQKIDIDIPKLEQFIHNCYILVARKLYTNIYLFEVDISPLEKQKNNRELEIIIKECILNAIRDSIPIDQILRNYLTETTEEDVTITEEVIKKPTVSESTLSETKSNTKLAQPEQINTTLPDSLKLVEDIKPNPIKIVSNDSVKLNINELSNAMANKMQDEINKKPMIKFNDIDKTLDINNREHEVIAPKTIPRLESISHERNEKRKAEEAEEDDSDYKIKILDTIPSPIKPEAPPLLNDIITL
tara:strand:- start:62 stop:1123 length:1062 start_codon:yes stop_codon:yes gene_type:complete